MLRLSDDEGRSWGPPLLLRANPSNLDMGFPQMAVNERGELVVNLLPRHRRAAPHLPRGDRREALRSTTELALVLTMVIIQLEMVSYPVGTTMAATISASQFKARCLGLMDQVAATGEVLVITKKGHPVAELPAGPSPQPLRSSSRRGDPWRSARTDRQRLGSPGVIVLDTHVLL